jgi:hypothetical protein
MRLNARTTGMTLNALLLAGLSLQGCIGGEKRTLSSTPSTDGTDSTGSGGGGSDASTPAPRYLYVASGACFGGDQTVGALATGSATIARYNLSTGAFDNVIFDYNAYSGGSDMPAGMIDYDSENLLVLVENTGGRRIDRVNKLTGAVQTFLSSSAISSTARDLVRMLDGGYMVSRATAVERFNANKVRVTAGANPYINAPAGSCATTVTNMVGTVQLPGGLIVFGHSMNANSTNNRIGVIASTGYNVAGDCKTGMQAPSTMAQPTALINPSSAPSQVLVPHRAVARRPLHRLPLSPPHRVAILGSTMPPARWS